MSHHSCNPFMQGTEKDSSRGPLHPGTGSYPSGFGHSRGSVGGLLTSLVHHSVNSPGQAPNGNLQTPCNLLVPGKREDVRLSVNQVSDSTAQLTYRSEFLTSNKGTSSYTKLTGHSEMQSKSVNVSSSSPAVMAGYFGGESVPFRVAEDDRSIPGLGSDDIPRPTPGDPSASSQPKYTFEAASNILQQFGLEMDDLEPLLSFPEDQVTPANLPFILRKIRTCKENASSSSADIDKKSVQNQASKIIDYGHTSKYVGNMVDSLGRFADGGIDSEKSKRKEDGAYAQRLQEDGKVDPTKHVPNVSNSHFQLGAYCDSRRCLPKTDAVSNVVPDYRLSTSETLKHIPPSSHLKQPAQEKSVRSGLSQTFHPSPSAGNKSMTNSSNMGTAVSELAKPQALQKTGMLLNPRRQPNLTPAMPPVMQTTQNSYTPAGLLSNPTPTFCGPPQSPLNHPFVSESTFKGSAIPRLITSNMQGATISPTNKVPSFKDTVFKGLPTAAMMHDYAATTPRIFPHTCSLCYKEFAQMKEWVTHQNSALHLENCKRLRKEYPQWDGSVTRALNDEWKNPNPTAKRSHGSRRSPKRQSPLRHGTRKQGRSRSRSCSPQTSSYGCKRSYDNRNSPERHHGSSSPRRDKQQSYSASRHHSNSPPRWSQERRHSPPRHHGSSSPRWSQEDWRQESRHHGSSPLRWSQERQQQPASASPKRQTKRSPTERCTSHRVSPGESKERLHSLKNSMERQVPPLKGISKRQTQLKGTKKDLSLSGTKEKSSAFESHEPNKSLKPNKSSTPGVKKTAEKLAKSVLGSSVLQSLPKQCDVEAVVKSLTPVILAEWGKIMVSSSAPLKTKKLVTSSTPTVSSSAAKKKPVKKKPAVSTLEAGKVTPPTMVKLSGIQPCISHHDVLSAVERYGRTKSVLLIRSRREAVVCFEKEEDARKVKTLEIKGCTVTPKPKETLKKEPKKSLAKKAAVTKLSSPKIAQSRTASQRKVPSSLKERVKTMKKCPASASKINPLLSKAKAVSTGGTVMRKKSKLGLKRRPVKPTISEMQTEVIDFEQIASPEEPDSGVELKTGGESSDQTGVASFVADVAGGESNKGAAEEMEGNATSALIPGKLAEEEDVGPNMLRSTLAHEDQNNFGEESLMSHDHSKVAGEGDTAHEESKAPQKIILPLNPIAGDSRQTLPPEQIDVGVESKTGGLSPDQTAGVVIDLTPDATVESKGTEGGMEVAATAADPGEITRIMHESQSSIGSPVEDEAIGSHGSTENMETEPSKWTGNTHKNQNTNVECLNLDQSGGVDLACDGQTIPEDEVPVQKPIPCLIGTERILPHKKSDLNFKKQRGASGRTDAATIVIDLTLEETDQPLSTFTVEPKRAAPEGTTIATPANKGINTTLSSQSSKVTKKGTNSPESVLKGVNLRFFRHMIAAHCDKVTHGMKLKDFSKLGLCNLVISQLPYGEPDAHLLSALQSALQVFSPPGWELDFYFLREAGVVIVPLPPGRCAYDILHQTKWRHYRGRKLHYQIFNSNVASSPLMFFQTIMKFIGESAVIDGSKTVFFGRITEEEVAELQRGFKDTESVQYFLPLYRKLFIEFSTLEDADQFGLQLSLKNGPIGKDVYRLGVTPAEGSSCQFSVDGADAHLFDASIPEGSHAPFWLPISSRPYLYPTLRPSFVIPEHRTIKNIADVEALAPLSDFRTVMFTNLPQECNAHWAIKRRVQALLTNVTPLFYNYCITVLPQQRRAFVHFDDWESYSTCLQDLIKTPIYIGKNKLSLHLVTQPMCAQHSEDLMYQSLMALSNTPVKSPHSLSERLLLVGISSYTKKVVGQLLDKVISVGPFVDFLPLGNRICIEMVNSEDVKKLVHMKQSSTHEMKLRQIMNFESCQDMSRRLNLSNERQEKILQSEGSGDARFPSSCQVEPARSDVPAPVNTPAGATQSHVSAIVQESELGTDVKSDAIVIDEDCEHEVKSDAGSTDTDDLRPSTKTPSVLQSSSAPAIPNMDLMFFTLKAAIREHRLAKVRLMDNQHAGVPLATDESDDTRSVSGEIQSECLVIVDEVSDMDLQSSLESRETRTDDFSDKTQLSSRPTQDKTNQTPTESHSSADDVDSAHKGHEIPPSDIHLQVEGVPAQSDGTCVDKQTEELQPQGNRNEDSCDDFENFEILDEFECQVAEEMDDANQDDRLETHCSEGRAEEPAAHVLNNKADQEESESFQVIDSINEDNAVEGQDSPIQESNSAGHLTPVVDDVIIVDGLSGKSLNAESCSVPKDVPHQCGIISPREPSTQDPSAISDVHPEAFQILDSVDDQSENEDEPKDRSDVTQLAEDTDVLQEDVEYEVIDSVDDQATTRGRENCSNWDTTDLPHISAAVTKQEPQNRVTEELYEIVDSVEGDQIHVSDIETTRRSSRTREKESNAPDGAEQFEQPDKCAETEESTMEESTNKGVTSKTRSSRSKRGLSREMEGPHKERMTTRSGRSLLNQAISTRSRRNTPTTASSACETLDSVEGDVKEQPLAKGRRRRPRSPIYMDQHDDNFAYQILDSVGEDMRRPPSTDENEFSYQVLDSVEGPVKTDETFSCASLEKSNKELMENAENEEEGIYQVLDSCDDEPPAQQFTESEATAENEVAVSLEKEDCSDVAPEHQISPDSNKRAQGETNVPMYGMDSAIRSILENLEDVSEEEDDSFPEASEHEKQEKEENLSMVMDETPIGVNKTKSVRSPARDYVVNGRRSHLEREKVVINTSEMVTVDEVTAEDVSEAKTGGVMEEDYQTMVTLDEISEEEEEEAAVPEIFPPLDEQGGDKKEKDKQSDNKEVINFVTVDEVHDNDDDLKKDQVTLCRSRRAKRLQAASVRKSSRLHKLNETEEEKRLDEAPLSPPYAEVEEPQIQMDTEKTDLEADSKLVDGASSVDSALALAHGTDQALGRGLAKRKSTGSEPEAKRACDFPSFTPNNPLGQEFVRPSSGFFCHLCSMFFFSESTAMEEHCSSQRHHDNVKSHYLKHQRSEHSEPSRESSALSNC
ncbi:uncharacterized protein LOC128756371 isoform X2 [Synchiropus splendidus]|uniref:uncharacterized protein LOC128756371 isoform X2 n=1 Tax=Synchiropus splendidus TaxID=270530 RepID=UPI00237EA887|nr:uncharacterized protein LOC128756371 isoform X2 [Synchiropus splendidus]